MRANTAQLVMAVIEGNLPPAAWAARRGPVVNFDLPPWARPPPKPTCGRLQIFPGGTAMGVPLGSQAGTPDGQATTSKRGMEGGLPVGFPARKLFRQATATGNGAPAPQPYWDTLGRARSGALAKKKGKQKSAPPDKVAGPPLPPKPNFGVRPSPHDAMNIPTEGKPTSLMQPQPLADMHPFTPTLKKWRHGITVDCGLDWSWDVIKAAGECGLHPTACTPKALALFEEDIEY